jgi:hypothetical protein
MEKFDVIFLGGGPTSAAVFDHYARKMAFNNKSILLLENECPEGAITKGAKVINSITPKLPVIRHGDIDHYREIEALLKSSEKYFTKLFDRASPFSGSYELGVRCCITDEEYDILQMLKGSCTTDDLHKVHLTAEFLRTTCPKDFKPGRMFPYREKLWDSNTYQGIIISNINTRLVRTVEKVLYSYSNGDNIILKIMFTGGIWQEISTTQLFVCKGIGNINFEKQVRKQETSWKNTFKFSVLPYYKRIYKPQVSMPEFLSSIFIPSSGICITNERNNLQSLLHDTNAIFCAPDKFDVLTAESELPEARKRLLEKMPDLPALFEREFICPMTLDPKAYRGNPEKHFEFIVSPSVNKNIHYLNLPYFTVIGTALQQLPNNLNDF